MEEQKKIRHDSFQIIMCIVVACILTVIAFHVNCKIVPKIVEKLTEKGNYKNLIWIVEHIAAFLPVPLVATVMAIFYSNKQNYVPVHSRKEQVFIAWMVAVFVYAVILGFVLLNKNEPVGEAVGDKVKTLWDISAEWFFAQIIPFAVLISYHSVRVGSEERELAESSDGKKRVEG